MAHPDVIESAPLESVLPAMDASVSRREQDTPASDELRERFRGWHRVLHR